MNTPLKKLTAKQIEIAAQKLIILLLWEATDNPDTYWPELFEERAEGRLTHEEEKQIMDVITDRAMDVLGKGMRLTNVKDIITFARKS